MEEKKKETGKNKRKEKTEKQRRYFNVISISLATFAYLNQRKRRRETRSSKTLQKERK